MSCSHSSGSSTPTAAAVPRGDRHPLTRSPLHSPARHLPHGTHEQRTVGLGGSPALRAGRRRRPRTGRRERSWTILGSGRVLQEPRRMRTTGIEALRLVDAPVAKRGKRGLLSRADTARSWSRPTARAIQDACISPRPPLMRRSTGRTPSIRASGWAADVRSPGRSSVGGGVGWAVPNAASSRSARRRSESSAVCA